MKILKNKNLTAQQNIIDYQPPYYLKHKPLYLVPYVAYDGPFANETDAVYLSIGSPQYEHKGGLSVKTWRYSDVNGKYSRLSEELPAHRAIDLTILLAEVFFGSKYPDGSLTLKAGTFANQDEELVLNVVHKNVEDDLNENEDFIRERLTVLRDRLNEILP